MLSQLGRRLAVSAWAASTRASSRSPCLLATTSAQKLLQTAFSLLDHICTAFGEGTTLILSPISQSQPPAPPFLPLAAPLSLLTYLLFTAQICAPSQTSAQPRAVDTPIQSESIEHSPRIQRHDTAVWELFPPRAARHVSIYRRARRHSTRLLRGSRRASTSSVFTELYERRRRLTRFFTAKTSAGNAQPGMLSTNPPCSISPN